MGVSGISTARLRSSARVRPPLPRKQPPQPLHHQPPPPRRSAARSARSKRRRSKKKRTKKTITAVRRNATRNVKRKRRRSNKRRIRKKTKKIRKTKIKAKTRVKRTRTRRKTRTRRSSVTTTVSMTILVMPLQQPIYQQQHQPPLVCSPLLKRPSHQRKRRRARISKMPRKLVISTVSTPTPVTHHMLLHLVKAVILRVVIR